MSRMGFCKKWMGWIKEYVFLGYASTLVNGSLTEVVKLQKGYRKGDPLAPFLFFIVAEGLSDLMTKAVGIGRFSIYNFL